MSCFPCVSVNYIVGFTGMIVSDAIPINASVSRVQCAGLCWEDFRCNSFFYNKHDRYCYLSYTIKDRVYHRVELKEAEGIGYYLIDQARGCRADSGYDFSRISDQCYRYYTEKKEWNAAQQECTSVSANLIPIHDDRSRDLMRSLISTGVVWIGLNDIASEQAWVWVDGSALTSNYWNPGEPLSSRTSNCVCYNPHRSQGWDDVRCNNNYPFVCKYTLQ
ncbi:CD209 antigen-like protein A [Haliotis rufescens]|uniref:CD209 antigen-like protein A n=1 Tax=Haliotis rufescens TaxID=6454 RepID=UPI00201EDB48|nr:CD209 antigen-like protein A [Haliotis rufescens]